MKPSTLYLVDDDEDMLFLLKEMATTMVDRVICYHQASEFLNENNEFQENSLLVLDLSMPGMDGIEVMRQLAKTKNAPSLILISGHAQEVLHSAEQLGKAHDLEIFSTITKPIKLDVFKKLLSQFFSRSKNQALIQQKKDDNNITKEELFIALTNDQLVLYYQPQFNIKTGKICACEALVRWLHPTKGLIPPNKFISLAESQGWMALLTGWVLQQAVDQGQLWNDEGLSVPVSVNISADNITSLSLPEQISRLLSENKLNPEMLSLEVTESALMGELVTSLDILTRLRLKGIGLSIDDFGTGYSSLSQLHKVPFSELKIDQSFVGSMCEDRESKAIVNTCIILGHELNMQVVAEGVETEEQLNSLKKMNCDIAQGYLLGRPMNAESITKILLENSQNQE